MKNAVIYIHGQGGNAKEADYYKKFFDSEHLIIEFDYKSRFPWEAQLEFPDFFDLATSQYNKIYLVANSIDAYYSMLSLANKSIEKTMRPGGCRVSRPPPTMPPAPRKKAPA